MKIFRILIVICSSVLLLSLSSKPEGTWDKNTNVYDALYELGEPKPGHFVNEIIEDEIERGRKLIFEGKAKGPNGQNPGYISRFYVCTSCHNTVREDKDLSVVDQDARLAYAKEKGISYLQASTFWGMVNRETWYNDDYVKKYGDLVIKANKSLKESVQLCATLCSQGRALKDWEMEAVLSYFWSIQLKLSDLDLNEGEWEILKQKNEKSKEIIKSKYLQKSPATFLDPPTDKKVGYNLEGRPELGENLFNLSCRHCHRPKGESDVVFDDSKATYRYLNKHKLDNSHLSIYEIIRHGTYAELGHKEYMPLYTEEKMSNQQLEDLRSFIEMKMGKN